MILYLVRHGQDDSTVRGGWSSSPLTEEGRAQVQTLAADAAAHPELHIARVLSSDLPRALETAQPVAALLRLPVELRPEFRETNNGELAGMKNDLALIRYPGLFWSALDWEERYPGGESPCMFFDRISKAWANLNCELAASGENALLVTHSGVIHILRHLVCGTRWSNREKQPSIPHARLIPLEYSDGKWRFP